MLRSIQVLRGVAACSVVMLHGLQTGGYIHSFTVGAAGVDLFFVISGFIMASIPKRSTFLLDRFWRIYPLWLIAVTPWIIWASPGGWQALVASLTLWPIYDTWVVPDLRVGWTLSFEMLFYFAVATSIEIGVIPLLGVFSVMLGCAALIRWPIFNYLGNPMIFEFLFGVVIANSPKHPRLSPPLLIAALLVLVLAPAWVEGVELTLRIASAWRVLYWGIPAAMIVYACVSAESSFQSRYWVPALILGDASYSIYLFHPGILEELPLWWPLRIAAAVVGGVIVWWLIERRLLALRKGRPPVTAEVPSG